MMAIEFLGAADAKKPAAFAAGAPFHRKQLMVRIPILKTRFGLPVPGNNMLLVVLRRNRLYAYLVCEKGSCGITQRKQELNLRYTGRHRHGFFCKFPVFVAGNGTKRY